MLNPVSLFFIEFKELKKYILFLLRNEMHKNVFKICNEWKIIINYTIL